MKIGPNKDKESRSLPKKLFLTPSESVRAQDVAHATPNILLTYYTTYILLADNQKNACKKA